jgi:hypothetical protein
VEDSDKLAKAKLSVEVRILLSQPDTILIEDRFFDNTVR